MNDIIKEKLNEIEKSENVRIIHAVESGSRAWGFASPDSDYDVRFIYVRPLEYYLKLEKTRDVIEWQLDETLDINGWDIQKLLRLLYKSNPTVFEWNNSPIIYKTTSQWKKVSDVTACYFQSVKSLHHYISMARTNYKSFLLEDTVKLKKYFYALRPVLACKWIINRQTQPPMLFSELCRAELDSDLKPEIERLLDLKMNSPEVAEGRRIDKLNDYIERSIEQAERAVRSIPDGNKKEWKDLNRIFMELILNGQEIF